MNSTVKTPHLNPAPKNGERRIGQRWMQKTALLTLARTERIHLSLSQRERMKVRDCVGCALRAPTKLLAERCRVLRELDDSKIAALRFHGARVTRRGHGRARDRFGNCVRRRPTRSRASLTGNRSRECMDRVGAVAGIYRLQNFGSADGAKESAHISSRSCASNERGTSQLILIAGSALAKAKSPLTSILSPHPGRGGFDQFQFSTGAWLA
jgi:hypothetical protein